MNRIAVTGPTGAIGIALIQECIKNKIEVYAICRPGSARTARIPRNDLVHIIECSLDKLEQLDTADIPVCDVFYHLAGQPRLETPGMIQGCRRIISVIPLMPYSLPENWAVKPLWAPVPRRSTAE